MSMVDDIGKWSEVEVKKVCDLVSVYNVFDMM
jgi:hypothetical protein